MVYSPEQTFCRPSWRKCFAGPIIATFLAVAVGLGAVVASLAMASFFWVIPVASVLFWFSHLFVFPLALTLVSLTCMFLAMLHSFESTLHATDDPITRRLQLHQHMRSTIAGDCCHVVCKCGHFRSVFFIALSTT